VLRLKQQLGINAGPAVIDAVLDMLKANTSVNVLYIQNFEQLWHVQQYQQVQLPSGVSSTWTR
jgi:hypothetical protein